MNKLYPMTSFVGESIKDMQGATDNMRAEYHAWLTKHEGEFCEVRYEIHHELVREEINRVPKTTYNTYVAIMYLWYAPIGELENSTGAKSEKLKHQVLDVFEEILKEL